MPTRTRASRPSAATARLLVLCIALAIGLAATSLRAAADDESAEYSIKAAYLYNFTRFVEWPTHDDRHSTDFVIGVVGCDAVAVEAIRETLRSKRTGDGRAIVVTEFPKLGPEMATCQLVFLGRASSATPRTLEAAIDSLPVLVVGDAESATQRGCAINFVVSGDAVRIEINLQRAERAHLKLSGRLANVARLVRDTETE